MQQSSNSKPHFLVAIWQQLNPNGAIQLVVIVSAVLLGMALMLPEQLTMDAKLKVQQQRLAEQQQRLQDLELQHRSSKLERQMETQSQQQTQQALTQQHRRNAELEKELAFFRSIMAPETIVDGVVVHDFAMDETSDSHRFRYQLVLTQQKVRKRYAKGRVSVVIEGSEAGKVRSYDLATLDQQHPKFGYSFRYFQEFSGEIELPPQFIPERISVRLNAKKNRGNSATHYPLDQLISEEGLALLNAGK